VATVNTELGSQSAEIEAIQVSQRKWEENLGIYRRLVGINPKFDKLITELSAVDNEGSLDKEATSYDDIFDPYRSAEFYHHKSD